MTKTLFVVFLFLIARAELSAQLSAYGSASYGYDQNPLSNYEKSSDQIQQNYLALNYLKEYDLSAFTLNYTSGLVLFNHFQERNYLEHSATGRYSFRFVKNSAERISPLLSVETKPTAEQSTAPQHSSVESDAENDSTAEQDSSDIAQADEDSTSNDEAMPEDNDSTDTYLDLALGIAARHDKIAYEEFDNVGAEAAASYRFIASENYFMRLTNSIGLRNYTNVAELSGITEVLTLQYAPKNQQLLSCGVLFSGGIKYYTRTQYDTARFETKRTMIQKSVGKGKLGGIIMQPSGKRILINPQKNYTTQFALGTYANKEWTATEFESHILYRYNPSSNARYLAQRSSASMLTGDLYNDYFSYQGFELEFRITQKFPLALQAAIDVELQQKKFSVQALTLDGDETGNKRKDLRYIITMMLSRSFALSEGVSTDVTLTVDGLRNKSNDEYNDFSSNSISLAVGIGL
jgi:hypothetical protein